LCIVFLKAAPGGTAGEQRPLTAPVPSASASLRPERPRLYFTREKVEALRSRLPRDKPFAEAWGQILQRAERYLGDEFVSLEKADGGQGQHGNYGAPSSQISGMASTLGLAYRLSGEARFAQKLKAGLLHYGRLRRWAGDAGHEPPWQSELNTARFCFAYAVGYDTIHDTLTPDERKQIAAAMVRLGIRPTLEDWLWPSGRIHALDSMGHNWWSVCVAMAGVASLALAGEVPDAAAWAHQVADAFPEWFAYAGNILQNKSPNFDREGAFYESVGYADYALSEFLLFRLAHANVFPGAPVPESPLLERSGEFFVHTCYPRTDGMLSVNFGDSSLRADGARTVWLLGANGYANDMYRWYLGQCRARLDDPLHLVYGQPESVPPLPDEVPLAKNYPDIGWAMMRSSWAPDATLLAVKSGFAWNHAHPDAGSFILFHGGEPLIIDSGNCSYSRREYTTYYRQSQAHNVVLWNGKGQNPEDCGGADRGVAIPGSVHHLLDAAGIRYLLADATGPTSWIHSRNYRHLLWIDGVILIVDDLRSHEPGRYEWLLHHEGTAQSDDAGLLVANGNRSQARVYPLFPEHQVVTEKEGLKDHEPDTKVTYLSLGPTNLCREIKFVTAIVPLPVDPNESIPVITPFQGPEFLGVTLRSRDRVTDVFLNLRADGRKMHRNSCHVLRGWETDAYLLGLTRSITADPNNPQAVERCFVACGSYVRNQGQVLLDSLSKLYAAFTIRQTAGEAALSGQPVLAAALWNPQPPQSWRLNGAPAVWTYDPKSRMVHLRLGRE
jgi:hypothetical protein